MRKDGFFKAGMGSQFGKTWRYRRNEMQLFILKYGAISIPAYDVERIKEAQGLEKIEVVEKATGIKYQAPVSAIEQGSHRTMSTWKEPKQFFIPVEQFSMKYPKAG